MTTSSKRSIGASTLLLLLIHTSQIFGFLPVTTHIPQTVSTTNTVSPIHINHPGATCVTGDSSFLRHDHPDLTLSLRSVNGIRASNHIALRSNRFDREYEEKAERRAMQSAKGGAGETAAGAILGGLVLGPFGALFGASIGSSLGAQNAFNKAKKQEMERMGVTDEMLNSAKEIGVALERGMEGLKATQDSLITQQKFAKRLDADAEQVYEQAKAALASKNEEKARDLLFQRQQLQDKLKKTLLACAEEKKRLERQQENVRAIEERGMEMEALLRRSVGAKALRDSSDQFSLADEDPLLQKFRDMGID